MKNPLSALETCPEIM